MIESMFKVQLHNLLCDTAKLLLHYYNPCEIADGKCSFNRKCCDIPNTPFSVKGLDRCPFLKDSGCAMENIECRTWLCDEAKEKSPECASALAKLEDIAKQYGFLL